MSIGWNFRFCLLRSVRTRVSRFFSPSQNNSANHSSGRISILKAHQDGFTIIETVVTATIISILTVMSASALSYYVSSKSVETSATELKTEAREVQGLAVATGNTYRINFSANHTYTVERRQGSDWIVAKGPINLEDGVNISATQPPDFGGDRFVEFYAKGTCESGTMVIEGRFGMSKTVTLDGETVNVRIT